MSRIFVIFTQSCVLCPYSGIVYNQHNKKEYIFTVFFYSSLLYSDFYYVVLETFV